MNCSALMSSAVGNAMNPIAMSKGCLGLPMIRCSLLNVTELTKTNHVFPVCSADVREHLWQCERHNPAAVLGHHAVPLCHAAGMRIMMTMGFSAATCFCLDIDVELILENSES